MGQTNLLLLALAVIIVGVAIVVAIGAFVENSVDSNFDNLLQHAIDIANHAQVWKATPEMQDGSRDLTKHDPMNYDGITFVAMGMRPYEGELMCHKLLGDVFSIEVTETGLVVVGTNESYQNRVVLLVSGVLEDAVEYGSGDTDSVVRGGYTLFEDAERTVVSQACGPSS